jgi:hypothetical protein
VAVCGKVLSYPRAYKRAWKPGCELKMNKIKTAVFSVTLLPLVAGIAAASDSRYDIEEHHKCHWSHHHCWSAPEIDPGQAVGALSLLGGTVAIIRGNRRKKK